MPIYEFRCPTCDTHRDVVCRIAEREANTPVCCGIPGVQVLHAAMVRVQAEARYRCPATGEIVTTRRKRRYLFEKHGLADADDFKSNVEKTKRRAAKDRELAAELYKGVPESVVNAMQKVSDAELAKLTGTG
jgi:hypothetical protein